MVRTEDLELAGEVVQDAAAYLGLTDLESTAHFPDHMQDFQAVLAKASSLHYQLYSICCWTRKLHPCHAAV